MPSTVVKSTVTGASLGASKLTTNGALPVSSPPLPAATVMVGMGSGVGATSLMVITTVFVDILLLLGLEKTILKFSSPSGISSSTMGTSMVAWVSPGAKVKVPLVVS